MIISRTRWFVFSAAAFAVIACSGTSAKTQNPSPPQTQPPHPQTLQPVASAVSAAPSDASADAPSTDSLSQADVVHPDSAPEDPNVGACPSGMKLVDGEYCTSVEQKCLVEWFAPQNKKRVCEQFESPSKCTGQKVHKRFCIDTYAWPNQKGERPEVMNNFYQAQVKCAAMGKRMCTESEWTMACEGPEMKPFPYGYVRDPKKCNGDHKWDGPVMRKVAQRDPTELARLWRGVRSGSQPHCISDYGVHDLPANNDEVVAGESPKAIYASVHTGGPWYSGVRNQCRPKVYTHDEGFYYYFLGFRCCSEADGKENELRTKKQITDRMQWKTIERLARFTVDEMKEKLELKKQNACTCKDTDILCKTMCGTLLGPGAVDGDDSTRVLNESRSKIQ